MRYNATFVIWKKKMLHEKLYILVLHVAIDGTCDLRIAYKPN